MCHSFMCHSSCKIVILKMSELEYICQQNNEILCSWDYIVLNSSHGFVFLKQSYFVFDVIMVYKDARK